MHTALPRLCVAGLTLGLLLSSGCTLRPRYGDVLREANLRDAKEVTVQVVDRHSREPIPKAEVAVRFGARTLRRVTDEQGKVTLPVDAYALKFNPVVLVYTPPEVEAYDLVVVSAEQEQEQAAEQGSDAEPMGGVRGKLVGPPREAAPTVSPWQGCPITAVEPNSRGIQCEGVTATLRRLPKGTDPREALHSAAAVMKTVMTGEMTIDESEVSMFGGTHRALRAKTQLPGEGQRVTGSGVAVAYETPEELRLISCLTSSLTEATQKRCAALMAALAKQTPDATVLQPGPATDGGTAALERTIGLGSPAEAAVDGGTPGSSGGDGGTP